MLEAQDADFGHKKGRILELCGDCLSELGDGAIFHNPLGISLLGMNGECVRRTGTQCAEPIQRWST